MQILSRLVSAVVLAINVYAVVALVLVLGIRAHDAAAIARHARRCGWSAAGFVLLSAVGIVASVITNNAHQGDCPAERAVHLAMLLSEVMNTVVFILLGTLLPLLAAAVLHLLARHARARSAEGEK